MTEGMVAVGMAAVGVVSVAQPWVGVAAVGVTLVAGPSAGLVVVGMAHLLAQEPPHRAACESPKPPVLGAASGGTRQPCCACLCRAVGGAARGGDTPERGLRAARSPSGWSGLDAGTG